jgi:hypothetical protein
VAILLALCVAVAARGSELDELKALVETQRQMLEVQAETIRQLQRRVDQIESVQQQAIQETQVPMATEFEQPPIDPSGNILFRRQAGQGTGKPAEDASGAPLEQELAEQETTPPAEVPPATDKQLADKKAAPEVVAEVPSIPSGNLLDGVVRRGDIPYSFMIPDSEISLLFDGYIKVDALYDSSEIGGDARFFPDTIAVTDAGAGETRISAQQTRFGVLAQKPSPLGRGRMSGYFEGDFYGSGTQNFRLRHAYGEVGGLLGGKTWSTFMDPASLPQTVALTAPSGVIFKRSAMMRWSQPFGERWEARAAVEEPNNDVALPPGGEEVKRYPNLVSTVRLSDPARGHLQLGGILRRPGFEDASGNKDFVTGWGLSLTGATRFGHDKLGAGLVYGDGIGNYLGGFATSRTAAGLSRSGDLKALREYGVFASYQHFWSWNFKSTLAYGIADVDNASGMTGGSVKRTQTASGNVIWSPLERFGVGLEYLYGKRENEDGSDGDDHRVQTAVQFGF